MVSSRAVEPEPKSFEWWSQSLKFEFPLKPTQFVEQANCTNKTMVFSFYWTKSVWSRSQKLLEVGAGAKKFGYLELEPQPSGVASPKIWWRPKNLGGTKCLILGE